MIPEDLTPPTCVTRGSDEERELAAMQVLANADGVDDALDLLAHLGLDVPSRTEAAA